MTNFNDFLNEQMKDPEFKAEWDALDPEFSVIEAMLKAGNLDALILCTWPIQHLEQIEIALRYGVRNILYRLRPQAGEGVRDWLAAGAGRYTI